MGARRGAGDRAGEQVTLANVAGLYCLVATCEANGVTRLDYLSDALLRIQDQPAAEIDDLLPHRPGRSFPLRRTRSWWDRSRF
jgi:hypothetical protein